MGDNRGLEIMGGLEMMGGWEIMGAWEIMELGDNGAGR